MRILYLVFLMLPLLAAAVRAEDTKPEAAAKAKKIISKVVTGKDTKDGKAGVGKKRAAKNVTTGAKSLADASMKGR